MSTATAPVKPKTMLRKTKAKAVVKPNGRLSQNGNGKAKGPVKPISDVPSLCADLRELQRQRVCNLKSRIMISNRLVATIATAAGYNAGMPPAERSKRFTEAGQLIQKVLADSSSETEVASGLSGLIRATSAATDGFGAMVTGFETEMERLAKQLPVAAWVDQPSQRGFGLGSLAKIVGEAGDLSNYSNPGKLWRRMGCAPFEAHDQMLMPSTWRRMKPGLSAEEWEECGYSPRRRSVMYVIGEGLIKQNGDGPYRRRYDKKKAEAAVNHPDWTKCRACKGSGKTEKGSKCSNCRGTGTVMMRPHLHGMLLAAKLLLKNLWIEWNEEWDYRYPA